MRDAHPPIAAVRKSVTVSLSLERTFDLFTRDIAAWWPLVTHSVGLARSTGVTFGESVGDELVETMTDGTQEIWGTVLEVNPPHRVAFTWHPGRPATESTHVVVTFSPDPAGGTVVELVHSGWERWEDGKTQASNYDEGWNPVLRRFVDVAHSDAD